MNKFYNTIKSEGSWIAILYTGGLCAAIQIGLAGFSAPMIQKELLLSPVEVGWSISIITLIGFIFGVVGGNLVERFGLRRSLIIGLLIIAAGSGWTTFIGSATELFLNRVLISFGYLLIVIDIPVLMIKLSPIRLRSLVLSLWGTYLPVGIATCNVFGALTVSMLGWRGVSLLMAFLSVIVAALTYFIISPTTDNEHKAKRMSSNFFMVYKQHNIMFLSMGFSCFTFIFLAFIGFMPSFLIETTNLTVTQVGLATSLIALSSIIGSAIAGILLKSKKIFFSLIFVGFLVPAIASFFVFQSKAAVVSVLVASIVVMTIGGIIPSTVFSWVPEIIESRDMIGPANGLVVQIGNLGSLIGPPALAAWVTQWGWSFAPLLIIFISGIGLLFFIRLHNHSLK